MSMNSTHAHGGGATWPSLHLGAQHVKCRTYNLSMCLPNGESWPGAVTISTGKYQRGLSEQIPKYAPFLHLKCVNSQPLHVIEPIFTLKCSWRYKLPKHMLKFVFVALCAYIDWAKAHMGHVNRSSVLLWKNG
eukprot:1143940-Pelagomonas_calceolata.AAC.1